MPAVGRAYHTATKYLWVAGGPSGDAAVASNVGTGSRIRITASTAAMASTAGVNPTSASKAAPSRNPTPLTAFFEPVSTATHRNSFDSPPARSNPISTSMPK